MNKTKTNPFAGALIPVLVVALVIASFVVGSLYTKVQMLQKGGALTQQPAAALQPQQPTTGVASVDDDPVLGDENAPITMIEFVDYECPFCKRFADETLPQIIKNYIDTGKVKLGMRDFPLSFHDPMA